MRLPAGVNSPARSGFCGFRRSDWGGSFVSAVWGMALLSLRRNRELLAINLGALLVGSVLVVDAHLHPRCPWSGGIGTAITEVALAALVPLTLRRRINREWSPRWARAVGGSRSGYGAGVASLVILVGCAFRAAGAVVLARGGSILRYCLPCEPCPTSCSTSCAAGALALPQEVAREFLSHHPKSHRLASSRAVKSPACPVCGGQSRFVFTAEDRNRRITDERFPYNCCEVCSTIFLATTLESPSLYYGSEYHPFDTVGKPIWSGDAELLAAEAWRVETLQRIAGTGGVIDIGAGAGGSPRRPSNEASR